MSEKTCPHGEIPEDTSGCIDCLVERVHDLEERQHHYMLRARDVDDPCPNCSGFGVRYYPSTATWRGGVGGASITKDVCDCCWGSGDAVKRWLDLRTIDTEINMRSRALAEHRWQTLIGAGAMVTVRATVTMMSEELLRLSRKRKMDFWAARACEYVASALQGTVAKVGG